MDDVERVGGIRARPNRSRCCSQRRMRVRSRSSRCYSTCLVTSPPGNDGKLTGVEFFALGDRLTVIDPSLILGLFKVSTVSKLVRIES